MKGIKKYRRQKKNQIPAIDYRLFEHNFVFSFKEMPDIYDEEFPPTPQTKYANYSDEYKLKKVLAGELYQELLKDEASNTFVTQVQAVGADYNETLDVEKERIYMYLGDEHGFLKIWDLTSFVDKVGVAKVKCIPETKGAYNPRRQEVVDCSAFTSQYRKSYQLKPPVLPPPIDPSMTGLLIREAKAHSDVITGIAPIDFQDCKGILTTSKDMKVRTWSPDLDMWGNINQKTDRDDRLWKFPTNQATINR